MAVDTVTGSAFAGVMLDVLDGGEERWHLRNATMAADSTNDIYCVARSLRSAHSARSIRYIYINRINRMSRMTAFPTGQRFGMEIRC
jgi:hypothetical protein